jgi:hypothetical protein
MVQLVRGRTDSDGVDLWIYRKWWGLRVVGVLNSDGMLPSDTVASYTPVRGSTLILLAPTPSSMGFEKIGSHVPFMANVKYV